MRLPDIRALSLKLPFALLFESEPHAESHAVYVRKWSSFWFIFIERVALAAVLQAAATLSWVAQGLYWISIALIVLPIVAWVEKFQPSLRIHATKPPSRLTYRLIRMALIGLKVAIYIVALVGLNVAVTEIVRAVMEVTAQLPHA